MIEWYVLIHDMLCCTDLGAWRLLACRQSVLSSASSTHGLWLSDSAVKLLFRLGKTTICSIQLPRQYLHRPHAFKPHLDAFRRSATPLRIAKLSPHSSHCPRLPFRRRVPHTFHNLHGQCATMASEAQGLKLCLHGELVFNDFLGHPKAA